MKTRNRHDYVNDKQGTGIDCNSMIMRNRYDFDLKFMIRRNLCDFVNGMESFNGTLVVARDANFDNMGGEQNDLVSDIDDVHEIPRVIIYQDELRQTSQKFFTSCLGDVNCDGHHDYDNGINLA